MEMAYFSNSYPIENEKTKPILDNLKNSSIAVACLETISFIYVALKVYTITNEGDDKMSLDLVHLGSMAHLFTCALKAFIAMQLHNHSSEIT